MHTKQNSIPAPHSKLFLSTKKKNHKYIMTPSLAQQETSFVNTETLHDLYLLTQKRKENSGGLLHTPS